MGKKEYSELDKVKVWTWIDSVLEASGQTTFSELDSYFSSKKIIYAEKAWSRWKSLSAMPSPATINLINGVLPGTAEIYNIGPHNRPVWDLLNGVEGICWQWFYYGLAKRGISSTVLQAPSISTISAQVDLYLWDIGFPEHPKRIEPEKALSEEELEMWVADRPKTFTKTKRVFNLNERVLNEENRIQSAYRKAKTEVETTLFKKHKEWLLSRSKLFEVDYLLSCIAMIQLCMMSTDKVLQDKAYYVNDGVNEAVADLLGVHAAKYLKSEY